MVDSTELRERIKSKGLKFKFVAGELGITPYGLALKIDNINEFTISQAEKLCELLEIKTLREKQRIFFAKKVE